MKKTSAARASRGPSNEIRSEYKFDYEKARTNRFAGRRGPRPVVVLLDPDVATVFNDAESVNTALHAILTAVPSDRR
jgi:hypothetical protein